MSSLALGQNQIEIQRGLTTSSTAIFVPFTTCELFQDGQALYYGLNAISSNLIMANRKLLKNPNGLFLGTPGCFAGDTRILLADGSAASFEELLARGVEEIDSDYGNRRNSMCSSVWIPPLTVWARRKSISARQIKNQH